MGVAAQKQVNAWFGGDRTVEQQLMGLDWLWANCKGRTVLDAGCAEGVIAIKCAEAGAIAVHGVDLVPERVKVGNRLRGDLPITFEVGNMDVWRPKRQYDIVLGLAILHKLRDPSACAVALANAARHAIMLRLPPVGAPSITDRRSGGVPHRIGEVVEACGFTLEHQSNGGPFGEWVGLWTR